MAKEYYLLLLMGMVGVHCTTEGTLQWQPAGLPIVQDLKGPRNTPLGSVSVTEAKTSRQEEADLYGNSTDKTKVKLPSLPCSTNSDCSRWSDPLLVCVEEQCTCRSPYCWVYHLESSGWTSRYIFSCGTCGTLGSSCNASMVCEYPGVCFEDGYCHCGQGENFNNICVVTDNSWMYIIVLGGLGVVTVIGFVIIIFNLLRNPPWRQQEPWCCGLCKGAARPKRRRSIEKTPAFTIQTMYSSQSEEHKQDAGGDSTHEQNRRELRESAASGDEVGSVSSAATQTTLLSGRSLASDVGAANTVVAEAVANRTLEDDAPEDRVPRIPDEQGSVKSEEQFSVKSEEQLSNNSLSSSCSHERCQLCLPKGLSSRPPSAGPPTPSTPPTGTTPRQSPSSRRPYAPNSNDEELGTEITSL
ncbi:uncharacterized protein LOC125035185 [Penaeus chinensis]|uniref:uncharacterized protein LOC125035185 n=1 Tax=Penaeus chinensis TaxID=139456 RepID=UPI001FB59555|nr:uncharacterized protein LOC125035185 [Penaeus chinensis]